MLAHLELDLPDLDAFVVRGVVPLPRRLYPMPGGLSPFALRDPDGTVVPAQVEIVSRHPRAADGAELPAMLQVLADAGSPTFYREGADGIRQYLGRDGTWQALAS